MENYEKFEQLSKIVAKPYVFTSWLLAILLVLSICANVYLATKEVDIIVENDSAFIESDNNINEVVGG